MSWRSSDYEGYPSQLAPGNDDFYFAGGNWGATRTNVTGDGRGKARFDLSDCKADTYTNSAGLGSSGRQSQVGWRFQIDGSAAEYNGIEVVPNVNWDARVNVQGEGGASVEVGALLIDDAAGDWPSKGSNYVEDSVIGISEGWGPRFGEESFDGTIYDPDNPLYIANPSDGDTYRIVAYAAVTAKVLLGYGSGVGDASEALGGVGGATLASVNFNWI